MNPQNGTDQPTILVTGGVNAKTGRRVAQRLRSRGLPVRAGSRSAEPPFDWTDRATWASALAGTTAAYVSYVPDLGVPTAPAAIADFAEVALAGGTRRLVLLSGRGEEEAQRAEQVLRESGAEWTVVRCSFCDQKFSDNLFLGPVLAGELALPVDSIAEPFVDAEDIADVAVAALTEEGHAGQVYELTGPRLLTFGGAIGEISRAAGQDIRYVPISVEEFTAALGDAGEPAELVSLLAYLFTEVMDGRNAYVTDGPACTWPRAPGLQRLRPRRRSDRGVGRRIGRPPMTTDPAPRGGI